MSTLSSSMSWFTSLFTFKPSTSTPIPTPTSSEKRLLEEKPPKPNTSPPIPSSSEHPPPLPLPHPQQTDRNRNKIILGAGLTFFAFSLLITRRSFARKRLAALPQFYTDAPANHARQTKQVSGAMEALEALNIATINVLSLGMVATGAGLWFLDVNSMADARRLLRGGLGVDGTGRDEGQAEEEFEEWMATVLSRREAKEKARDESSSDKRVNERGRER